MKQLVLTALVMAFGIAPSAAFGKSCVRIDVTPVAHVGQPIRATVRTFTPHWVNGKLTRLEPVAWPLSRLMLTAHGPGGQRFEVPSWRTGAGYMRVARIVFPTTGAWRLVATNWAYAPRSCAPPARVTVQYSKR